MTKHTPTPWRRDIGKADKAVLMKMIEAGNLFEGVFAEEQCVALCGDNGADSAFIVRACNAHDALVEALKAMLLEYGGMYDEARKVEKQAVEALKLAGAA